jgi:hypothetical protein
VKEAFFPGKQTDALVLAETREASPHATAVLRSIFPTSFHEITSPVTGTDRIVDAVASLKNNDIPTFIRSLGFVEAWPGEPGRLSGPCTLDHLKKTLFPRSAKQSQWLARACAWY